MGASNSLQMKQPYNSIAYRILVAILWTQYTVMPLVKVVIQRLPYVNFLAELFVPMSIIITAMACLPWFLRHIRGGDLAVYVGVVLVVLFSMIFYPSTVGYVQDEWWTILVAAVPMYFIGVSFSLEDSENDLFWCSLFSVVGMFVFRVYLINSGRTLEKDDMDAAYRMLPSIMYLVYYASRKKQIIYKLIALFSTIIVFMFGTRGPIICILVYFIALIFSDVMRTRNIKKFALFIVATAVIFAIVLDKSIFVRIISAISGIFEGIGFSTRVFDFILAGNVLESKGREHLINSAVEAIIRNPVRGYGFMGDRYLLGFYVHNIWIELWCHFGVVLGTLVMLVIVGLPVAALIKTRGTKQFRFLLMMFCLVFVKLTLSSSYVLEPFLYLMLGFSVAILRRKKPIKRSYYRKHPEE